MKSNSNTQQNLLFCITGLGVGGAEQMLLKIIKEELIKKKSKISLLVINPQKHLEHEFISIGVNVFYLRSQLLDIKNLWNIFNTVAKTQIFIGWMYHGNVIAFILSTLFFKPFIQNIRQSLSSLSNSRLRLRVILKIDSFASRFAKYTIYNSYLSKTQHENILRYCTNKSLVIPNGFEIPDSLPTPEQISSIRKKMGLLSSDFVVLHVARYHPDKDQKTLILAFIELLKQYPQSKLILVGQNLDRNNIELTNLIPQENTSQFIFLGSKTQEDLKSIFTIADTFTLTSIAEAFPNVIGEAMCYGVYPISTQVGDAEYIINSLGKTISVRNINELVESWTEYISYSTHQKQDLRVKTLASVRDRFDIKIISQKYFNAFLN